MRYVVEAESGALCAHRTIEEARACHLAGRVYELGDEVTEPDPTALVEWMREQVDECREAFLHHESCRVDCHCGLNNALRKAGIE